MLTIYETISVRLQFNSLGLRGVLIFEKKISRPRSLMSESLIRQMSAINATIKERGRPILSSENLNVLRVLRIELYFWKLAVFMKTSSKSRLFRKLIRVSTFFKIGQMRLLFRSLWSDHFDWLIMGLMILSRFILSENFFRFSRVLS